MRKFLLVGAALLVTVPAVANETRGGVASQNIAPGRVVSGGSDGLRWTARSMMVGQTSTLSTSLDPVYSPSRPGKDGLAFLEIDFGPFGFGYCSGSLMNGGTAILTAAHCVADTSGDIAAVGGFAYFYPGPNDPFYDLGFGFEPGIQRVSLGSIAVAPGYTGDVIDHNDLAIIFLGGAAPGFAIEYDLDDLADPAGVEFNVAGFGNNGEDGTTGAFGGTFGRLREGDNRFEYRLGDPDFGTFWADELGEPLFQIEDSWVSDFDRTGDSSVDASCTVATDIAGLPASGKFCDTGVGAREVGVAGGDSGGPQFVDGKIVSVTSYGLTFGSAGGDFDDFLNSSYGEFSGFAPVGRNREWIERLVPGAFGDIVDPVPAPASLGLLGIGLALIAARSRRRA